MDNPSTPSAKPKKASRPVCQFGKRCYRKNPVHFAEYSHLDLEKIVNKGRNSDNEFDIPDDLLAPKEDTRQQLVMLEGVMKKNGLLNPVITPSIIEKPTPKRNLTTSTPLLTPGTSASHRKPEENKRISGDVITLDSDEDDDDVVQVVETPSKKPKLNVPKIPEKQKPASPAPQKHSIKPVAKPPSTPTSSRAAPPTTPSTSRPGTSKLEQKPKTVEPRLVANDLSRGERKIEDYIDVVYPKGEAIKKFEASHPYNYFLTAIVDSPATHKEQLSITLQEVLDKSLGDLESSVQINFMVDIGWLLGHYYFAGHNHKPLLVLYGDESPELAQINSICPHVTAVKIRMTNAFATHHSKVMLLGYSDRSMRVVVSTANLYEDDWRNRSQGVWISPRCYEMDDQGSSSNGESVTGFRSDLIRYLNKYSLPQLQEWTSRIQRTDFSSVKVFLICSVPGSHQTLNNVPLWGHLRAGHFLGKHAAPIDDSCPFIAQSSSIGSLGNCLNSWILEITTSFCRDSGPSRLRRTPAFKMIFPSYGNVLDGHDGLLSGGGLPYRRETHMKQRWLENHLHLWKANQKHRSKAMPHIKTYCRYSESEGLHWFCLTSANLSKAAWGSVNRGSALGQVLRINNYEVGVLFVPKILINRPTFPLKPEDGPDPVFPMIYDLPLAPYSIDDAPFFSDYLLNALK